jgi:hypothetical protein
MSRKFMSRQGAKDAKAVLLGGLGALAAPSASITEPSLKIHKGIA